MNYIRKTKYPGSTGLFENEIANNILYIQNKYFYCDNRSNKDIYLH